jgi:hypothetical protein
MLLQPLREEVANACCERNATVSGRMPYLDFCREGLGMRTKYDCENGEAN